MLEYYGGERLNTMVSYLKSNSINKIRSREIYLDLEIDQIKPMEDQPRKYFDDQAIEDLRTSIEKKGLSTPILVRREGEQFRIIAGERRWRAFKSLGRKKIPAIIKEVKDDKEAFLLAAIENLQREDLNVIEEALCYQKMLDTGAVQSQKELAAVVGRNKSKISERLSLLKLPEKVKEILAKKDSPLSEGHGIELIRLKDPKKIENLVEQIQKEKLTRDQVRAEINNLVPTKKREEKIQSQAQLKLEPVSTPNQEEKTPLEYKTLTKFIDHELKGPATNKKDTNKNKMEESSTDLSMEFPIEESDGEMESKDELWNIRFVPYGNLGFDLMYRFRPEQKKPSPIEQINRVIEDLGRQRKALKKFRKELKRKGFS